jgi:hypothetical protein
MFDGLIGIDKSKAEQESKRVIDLP